MSKREPSKKRCQAPYYRKRNEEADMIFQKSEEQAFRCVGFEIEVPSRQLRDPGLKFKVQRLELEMRVLDSASEW